MTRPRSFAALSRVFVLAFSLVAFALVLPAFPASADEDGEESDSASSEGSANWYRPPGWVSQVGLAGRYVGTLDGSNAKYLEDHNIQSGPVFSLGVEEHVTENATLSVEGMVEPLQKQGYLLFDYSESEKFSVHSDIQAWTEFYNTRTGGPDETAIGTRIGTATIAFPTSTDSRNFFRGGKPNVDWLRTRSGVEIELPGPFNDVSADFIYRRIGGQSSLLKGGTVLDSLLPLPAVAGSGPGTVSFDVSSRKRIDYKSIGGVFGLRSNVRGLNLSFDGGGMKHRLKSTVQEANFGADDASSELELYRRDTTIGTANYDFVVSRNIRHNLFVFGGHSFSWERSEPDPSESVQAGILTPTATPILTRQTIGSAEVTRFSEAITGGAVFTPVSNIVVRASASIRASQSEGNLTERRTEGALPFGDIGVIRNDSKRDMVSGRARIKGDWKMTRRLSMSAMGDYDFRYEDAESTRRFNFVVGQADEREDYTNERSKFRAGVSAKYRMTRGRTIEGGYEFTFVDSQTDVDALSNQFILADYQRLQHRFHAKAQGRFGKKVRLELRAQYVFENRTLDAPNADPPDVATGGEGEIDFHGFTIVPVMIYQINPEWSGVASASITHQQYQLVGSGSTPLGFSTVFSGFEYEVLTETLTMGVNWVPSERFSNSLSYSIYHSSESVENTGHDAAVRSKFSMDENWSLDGSLRYLSFRPGNGNRTDDYHTIIVSMGVTGHF